MRPFKIMRTLVLLLAGLIGLMQSPALFAGNSAEALAVMDWPLQPGETVRDIAQLIYPKNPRMQKYFIAETIKLNQETQPDLHPSTIFSQPNVILIPSIKQLSKKSVKQASR
jgi:hypothetical protein